MINKAKKIKELKRNSTLYKLSPLLLLPEKLIRLEYVVLDLEKDKETKDYKIIKLYLSNENGNLLDNHPLISQHSMKTEEDFFKIYQYIIIE